MKRNLDALEDGVFDLLIIGGGITGAGVALDAGLRGFRVALVDKGDFASGTSSVSSKLIHGGLRYLEHGGFHLVYEALHERGLLLQNALHSAFLPGRPIGPLEMAARLDAL
jgi:glycerol-3-phosphate dehydrogenase